MSNGFDRRISVYLTGIRYNLFYLCHLARILEASDDRNADRAFVVYRLFFGFYLVSGWYLTEGGLAGLYPDVRIIGECGVVYSERL